MIRTLIWIGIHYLINMHSCQEIDINVNITQLFIYKISPEMLSWNDKGMKLIKYPY